MASGRGAVWATARELAVNSSPNVMPIPRTDFLYDTSLSCLCSQAPPSDRGGVSCTDTADTSLHVFEVIRCVNALKPFPHNDACVVHNDGEPRKKIYYFFILVIAEPSQGVRRAIDPAANATLHSPAISAPCHRRRRVIFRATHRPDRSRPAV